jgi:hypothetical protein
MFGLGPGPPCATLQPGTTYSIESIGPAVKLLAGYPRTDRALAAPMNPPSAYADHQRDRKDPNDLI